MLGLLCFVIVAGLTAYGVMWLRRKMQALVVIIEEGKVFDTIKACCKGCDKCKP